MLNQDKHSSHIRSTGQRYSKIEILPYLWGGGEKRDYGTKSDLFEVILCILYKLKMDLIIKCMTYNIKVT